MKHSLLLAAMLASNFLNAAAPIVPQQLINHKDWSFVENKGQLLDENRKPITDVKYYSHEGNVHVFCRLNKISFVFIKTDNEQNNVSEATASSAGFPLSLKGAGGFDPSTHQTPFDRHSLGGGGKITTSRMDLLLINANPNTQITATDQQAYYENYYTTGDANHGITNVHTYNTITYKNIYPHIDMILNCGKSQSMEYSFLVHPGGKVSDIKLKWNGRNKYENLENACQADRQGRIKHSNALGSIEESAPKSFVDGRVVRSSFIKMGTHYSFKLGKYDKRKDLLIDPSLVWTTLFDWNTQTEGNGVKTDGNGNIYVVGATTSNSGIATSGAYITSYEGGVYDAFLAKFSPSGNINWATYYGGSDADYGEGLSTDDSGNVFISGYTGSGISIATSGAYQTFEAGNVDAFLAKFNNSGSLIWATYFGGNGSDDASSVSTDALGNVYITGGTNSSSGIATSGAYQTSNAGINDAFIAKFSSSGSLSWATYYGGSGDDYAESISTDVAGNVYISGVTESSSGIATSGAYQKSESGTGNDDAFLAKFTSTGKVAWATYYGAKDSYGGASITHSDGVTADLSGNIYITGVTETSSDIASGIATIGAYQTSNGGGHGGGGSDAFLAKFSSSGNIIWATYYGGNGNDEGHSICTDAIGNVYITGITNSTNQIATIDAYDTSIAGGNSTFLAQFGSTGSLLWATYFAIAPLASGVCADYYGNVYITGHGVFLAKFRFKPYENDAGIDSINNPHDTICAGTQSIKVHLQNYGIKNLTSVNIGWSVNGIVQKNYSWLGSLGSKNATYVSLGFFNFASGLDTIKIWTYSPNGQLDSLPSNDTTKFVSTVNPLPLANVGSFATICNGNTTNIGSLSTFGNSYIWISNPSGFASTSSNPIVSPSVTTVYVLSESISSTGCSKSDSLRVTVNLLPIPIIDSPLAICNGNTTSIGASLVTGHSYSWTSNPSGYTSTNSNPIVKPLKTTLYWLIETITTPGCSMTDTVMVIVNPLPKPNIGTAQTICQGKNSIIGTSLVNGNSYSWISNPAGFTSTNANPNVNPGVTTTYRLTETIIATGCSNYDSVKVTVNSIPNAGWTVNNLSKNYYFHVKDSSLFKSFYFWDFGDGSNSTGYSADHVFPQNKMYLIKLSVTNLAGCIAENDSTINVTISGIVSGINTDIYGLNIYPNPFNTKTIVHFTLPVSSNVKVNLMDMKGDIIYNLTDKNFSRGQNEIEINTSEIGLTSGSYFVNIMINGQTINRKVIEVR